MIQLKKISKIYNLGGSIIRAVDNITLEIKDKELVAIVGPSGSGKSTLLNLIGGLDKPDKGEIFVDSVNLGELKDNQLAQYRNKNIGFVFQTFNLQPILTAAENTALPLVFANISKKEREKRALTALEKVDLAHRKDHKPSELSGGESQRTAIARALVNNPKILIADEPTGNLDSKTGKMIMELFRKLNREQNIIVIIVTHNPKDAALADHQIIMSDGKITENKKNVRSNK